MSSAQRTLAKGLAGALLAGEWSWRAMLARAADGLGAGGTWLRDLIQDAVVAFPNPPHDARDRLADFILKHERFQEVWTRGEIPRSVRRWFIDEPRMLESRWPVQRLDTLADVSAWLGAAEDDLTWFADRKGLEHTTVEPRLHNYRYAWVMKRSGGVRLLEAPKSRLKGLQRKILRDILDAVLPHEAAHGFRKGRSPLTHARLHAGNETVIRFDLRAYFAEVHPARAFGLFRSAGYPEEVARTLIALCTNRVPLSILSQAPRVSSGHELNALFHLRRDLSAPHLPQGAPTSPALANLCSYALDVRLTALAATMGAIYSRYADDLTFSGDASLSMGAHRLERAVSTITREEGFTLNPRKTRVMRAARRQTVTGIVVNAGVNVGRTEFDRLKATLHNCVRHGASSQAREQPQFRAHLLGQVSWVEQLSPRRGAALRTLFERITWDA